MCFLATPLSYNYFIKKSCYSKLETYAITRFEDNELKYTHCCCFCLKKILVNYAIINNVSWSVDTFGVLIS